MYAFLQNYEENLSSGLILIIVLLVLYECICSDMVIQYNTIFFSSHENNLFTTAGK